MGSVQTHKAKPDCTKVVFDKSKRGLSYGVASMKGWRSFMQDTYIAILNFNNSPDLDLFAILDGHGGPQVAIFVKQQFPKQLATNKNFLSGNYHEALRQTFLKMDKLMESDDGKQKLFQIVQRETQKNNCNSISYESNAGCTALVCMITQDKIYIANAGDSKGIACVHGQSLQLNHQHKPTVKQEEQRIKLAGGYIQYGRIMGEINISRTLGDFQYKDNMRLDQAHQMIICQPQIMQIQKQGVDLILLGCDGIWEKKTSQQMLSWLKHFLPRIQNSKKLSLLFDQQVSKQQESQQGKDNMSAILITLK